jgi:hypothetical protein
VLDNHSWLEEKNQLVQAHNDAKVKLITEIQTLRKMLTPTAEQHFNELRGSEFLRVALEEEVINTHIQNDNLKVKMHWWRFHLSHCFRMLIACCLLDVWYNIRRSWLR